MHVQALFKPIGFIAVCTTILAGCINTGQLADGFANSMLAQRDPVLVRDGAPAYLLLIDGLIHNDPQNSDTLLAGSRLYGAYAGSFVDDPLRAQIMAHKARDYAQRALCIEQKEFCKSLNAPLPEYQMALTLLNKKSLPSLYAHATAWAGWIQANTGDWQALIDLPKVEASFQRIVELDDEYDHGQPYLYLGVLASARPAMLGGNPEQGRIYFEKVITLSQNRNLMAKTLYAKFYARGVFDQALHDRLLNEVIAANPEAPGFTLMNVLAQQQAKVLLDESANYF
ncbi:MAG: hypothetical protein H0W44_01295 [Gammaproteobacteria bacterium]|nr:hypothetical protein [Gammaproteobacteria bacterium]